MSAVVVYFVIMGFLALLIVVIGLIAFIDWRAIIIRRYGPSYKKGLAHILLDGVWVYRESSLIFEGDDAMTYSRSLKVGGKKIIVEDVVPNSIGFDYDEYTGERVYRVAPGGCVGYSDGGVAPAVDYPAELISAHVLDRTVSGYAASVSAEESGFNFKILIYTFIAGAAIVAVLLMSGVIKLPGATVPSPPGQNTERPAAPNSGPMEIE